MIAYDIEWDIDAPGDADYLPESIPIPKELISDLNSSGTLIDVVSDYITEQTGFCHNGFTVNMAYESETRCGLNIKDINVLSEEYTATMNEVTSKTWDIMRTVCQLFGVDFDNPDEIPRSAVKEITEKMLCYAETLTGKKIEDIIIT